MAARQKKPVASSSVTQTSRAYRAGWWCFLAFVLLCPITLGAFPPSFGALAAFRANDPFDLPKVVLFFSLCGISLAAFSVAVFRKEAEVYWDRTLWVLVGLAGWAGISTVLSASPLHSVWGSYSRYDGLLALVSYALAAFLALQYVRDTRALRAFMLAAAVASALVSVYALMQYFGIDPYQWQNDAGRVASTYGNADMLGTYLLFPLFMSAGLAITEESRPKAVALWAVAALSGAALLATQTRGAWIGALVAALAFTYAGWRQRWKVSRARLAAYGAAGVVALIAIAAAIVAIRPRRVAGSGGFSAVLDAISNGRSVIWVTGVKAWLLRPVFGWGPDAFSRAFARVAGADWFALTQGVQGVDNAHNFLVQWLVTLGLPGLVLTLWVLVQAGVLAHRTLATRGGSERVLLAAVWATLIGLSVALFFGLGVTAVAMWLWTTLGVALAFRAKPVARTYRAVWPLAAALGIAFAVWSVTWLVADVYVGLGSTQQPGPLQAELYLRAANLNPLSDSYRWQAAEASLNATLASQQAGASPVAVDAGVAGAIQLYYWAADNDPGDYLVRLALTNVLTSYASRHPGTDAAQQAVTVAEQARSLAPGNPAALVALAKAYQVAGRAADAAGVAREARRIAPDYAAQYLGSLGR